MTMSSIIYFLTLNYIFGYDYTNAYSNSLDLFTLIAVSLFMVILSFAVVVLVKLVQKSFTQQLFVKTLNYFSKRITRILNLI